MRKSGSHVSSFAINACMGWASFNVTSGSAARSIARGCEVRYEHGTGHFGGTARDHRGSPFAWLLGVDRTAAVSAVRLAVFPVRQDWQDHVLPESDRAMDP